MSAIHRRR